MRVVSLIGLTGSGKSEVGRALARRLGWEFFDTDAEIEAREGRTVPHVFGGAGEKHFRAVERAVVRDAVRRRDRVIATGGGAVLSAASRRALARAGPVFYLRVPVEVLLRRLDGGTGRPLLGDDPRASLERLLQEREPLYVEIGAAVDAGQPVDAVVEDILARLAALRRHVRVDLGARSYDVHIGTGLLMLVGTDLTRIGARGRVAIVTHRALARKFGTTVVRALEGSGFVTHTLAVPPGERAKSLRQVKALLDALAVEGFTRADTVLAVGGGVVGDLAGFVAGIYMRGIRVVHVPTTLLAQIDSSIGGKTAVNHPCAKNLIGVYHQPALVIADIATLTSLPLRERRAGLAEAVKYGMVIDRGLFELLERDHASLTARAVSPVLEEVVYRCASVKAHVVSADEYEHGFREVLNYGHTVGHAIETAMSDRVVHGEAVAIGMRVEARIAVRLGLLDADAAERQDALLTSIGLPVHVPAGPVEAMLDAMRLDKKRRNGRIRCTLPEGIGRARLGVEVPEALIEEVVVACQEGA
jgi:3-dehydroquinate synthase